MVKATSPDTLLAVIQLPRHLSPAIRVNALFYTFQPM